MGLGQFNYMIRSFPLTPFSFNTNNSLGAQYPKMYDSCFPINHNSLGKCTIVSSKMHWKCT